MAKKVDVQDLLLELTKNSQNQYNDLDKRLDNIEKVMIAQEINLKTHMARSEHLETIVESIQEKDLKQLNKHVALVEGAFKLLGILSIVISILTGIAKLFHLI